MDVIVLLLLIVGIVLISVSWVKKDLQCPPPQIIYRYVPANIVDVQFSDENLPSKIYTDMFNNDNIGIGGYAISSGKTFSEGIKLKRIEKSNLASAYASNPRNLTTTSVPKK